MSEPGLPAVVLGIDTPTGLAIVRDLGAHGVRVYGIAREKGALGMWSRYLYQGLLRADGEAALIEQLCEIGQRLGRACLFAISENDIAMLNRYRDRLVSYQLMFADEARMTRVLNKEQTYAAAVKIGMRVPRTEQVGSIAEVLEIAASLHYPVVLKWANPNDVMHALSAAGLPLDKTHYCYSSAELLAYLRQYEAVGIYPLIQEYCAGYGLGQFVLMRDGVAHYVFQHRRVHEWPPEGGFSSLCESVALSSHSALMVKSIALLRDLEWEGVAMVEYRHDPATGESALMEINGRFWGSLPLAYHAGASFPWLNYCLFGKSDAVAQQPYRSGLRCRFMVPETKRLMRILFQKERIADKNLLFRRRAQLGVYLADFIRPQTRYYVFEWRDPAPFFGDIANMLREMARAVFRRREKDAAAPRKAGL